MKEMRINDKINIDIYVINDIYYIWRKFLRKVGIILSGFT